VGFGADGVVALEVSGYQVVGVNELTHGDGLRGEADNLVELTDGLAGGNCVDGELVASGDVGGRNKVQAIEGLSGGHWLEGDHNVVRGSEFESVGAQPVPISLCFCSMKLWHAPILVRPHSTPTKDKRIVCPPTCPNCGKVFFLRKIGLDQRCKVFIIRDLPFGWYGIDMNSRLGCFGWGCVSSVTSA
jgi:hypothetical protein